MCSPSSRLSSNNENSYGSHNSLTLACATCAWRIDIHATAMMQADAVQGVHAVEIFVAIGR